MKEIRKQLDNLMERFRCNDEQLTKVLNDHDSIEKQLRQTFSRIITEEQLLAPLDWKFRAYSDGSARITCNYLVCEKAKEFFGQMTWISDTEYPPVMYVISDTGRRALNVEHGALDVFCHTLDDLLHFCNEQGIKPDVEEIKAQRSTLKAQLDEVENILERLQ